MAPDTGGLLRKIGKRGILSLKEFATILGMGREIRTQVLDALREIYDGFWERNVGVEGGQTLTWSGRLVVIAACTTAWDQAHAVIAVMGDRFVLIRPNSRKGREESAKQALKNTGHEKKMRAELADAVAALMQSVNPSAAFVLSDDDVTKIIAVADLVTLARTAVERDYQGNVIDSHDPEAPTCFAKQLQQILRGGIAIGMTHDDAMALVIRCAQDSIPPLRLLILREVNAHAKSRISEIRRRIQKPWRTVERGLEALHMIGLVHCDEEVEEVDGTGQKKTVKRYSLNDDGIDLTPLGDPEPDDGSGRL
jgi:DNA-binding transcriptional ArsR family regulator